MHILHMSLKSLPSLKLLVAKITSKLFIIRMQQGVHCKKMLPTKTFPARFTNKRFIISVSSFMLDHVRFLLERLIAKLAKIRPLIGVLLCVSR